MKMKNWMRNAGFTLVELIVVIAVLGVLGAGAAVGYSGYTKKAAKSADQQLAAQIKYALEVAQVSDPMPNGAAALVLSKTGAKVTPEATEGAAATPAAQWVSNAMANAFGDNWKNELKLQYGEWGKGSAISASTLGYFGNASTTGNDKYDEGIASVVTGAAVPSFANDVDDLFVMIRDTAIAVNGLTGGESGAKLAQDAAEYTTGAIGATTAEDFAKMWASREWADIKNNNATGLGLNAGNVANAGVVKARNVALACYLRSQNVPEDICQKIENFSSIDVQTDTIKLNDPYDVMAALYVTDAVDSDLDKKPAIKEKYVTGDEEHGFRIEETHQKMVDKAKSELSGLNKTVLLSYFKPDSTKGGKSQAYLDGLAYYTMMSTVNNVNKEGHSANDDTYWDEMAGAVGLYGSIARGETTLAELKAALENAGAAEGDVSIAVMAGQKGLTVRFSPLTIAP